MAFFNIIVPTFNSVKTIRHCLESILTQTCKDLNLIIIDGCSSDGTLEIVKNLCSTNKNILLISEIDNGIYDAMNKGVDYSTGDWLYFLGSDDYLHDLEVLNDVKREISISDVDMIYGDAIVMSNRARHGGIFDFEKLVFSHNMCHQTIFYRRSLFKKIGYYNLKYPIIADWDFNIKCFERSDIRKKYFARDIVHYNDVTGISSTSRDDPFYALVPATYIKEINRMHDENQNLLLSREFKLGQKVYKILRNIKHFLFKV